jgi:hypothetical protein
MRDWQIICNSIKNNPTEWSSSPFRFTHKTSGLCMRISNGPLYIKPYESHVQFTVCLAGKFKIWRAYKEWLHWKLKNKLGQNESPASKESE